MVYMNKSSPCPLYPDKPDRCDVIIDIKRAVAGLSIVGCIFIIFLCYLFKKLEEFSQRMIFCLSLSAMANSICYIIGDGEQAGTLCYAQATLISYFDWSTLLIVCCITFYIWHVATKRERKFRRKSFCYLLCFILPIPFASLPFLGNSYGPAGVWCWITDSHIVWRLTIWYVPMYILMLLMLSSNCYIVIKVFFKARQWDGTFDFEREKEKRLLLNEVKGLLVYPFIYLMLTIPPLIYRVYSAFHQKEEPSYGLMIATVIVAPLLGAVNSVAFAMDKETLSRLNCRDIRAALCSHLRQNRYQMIEDYQVDDAEPSVKYGAVLS